MLIVARTLPNKKMYAIYIDIINASVIINITSIRRVFNTLFARPFRVALPVTINFCCVGPLTNLEEHIGDEPM